ncbi:MAG: ArsR/SmtB family transcription factor [Armatimonadota bacterium]
MKRKKAVVQSSDCCEDGIPSSPQNVWQNEDEELAALAKALGHPARVQIVRFLIAHGEGQCICGDICEEIPLAQSTVSQHLKVLKEAGLIRGEVDGPRICYSIDGASLARLKERVAELLAE